MRIEKKGLHAKSVEIAQLALTFHGMPAIKKGPRDLVFANNNQIITVVARTFNERPHNFVTWKDRDPCDYFVFVIWHDENDISIYVVPRTEADKRASTYYNSTMKKRFREVVLLNVDHEFSNYRIQYSETSPKNFFGISVGGLQRSA